MENQEEFGWVETRTCKICKKCKEITEFTKREIIQGKQIYRYRCRECTAELNKKRRIELLNYTDSYKKATPCQKCGFDDFRALQFHHINREDKSFTISEAVKNRISLNTISREIKKCLILCANCHQILHWNERNQAEMVE